MTPRVPRLDHEPLAHIVQARGLSFRELGRRSGVKDNASSSRLLRAPLRWDVADRYACALGMHPAEIWGDDWWTPFPRDGEAVA